MPREVDQPVPLDGLALPDARTGQTVDLGALPGSYLLTAIRHRY
ncbi:MAG TPA: hypothetical protein VHH53_01675 [Pseudonocardiaceae bacterium]|nr:hypothetical protein [Pseudonocardiaceae bacterium]HEX2288922.1 hypothetical protein [Pseudonocardiaceae bacterium]